MTKQNQFMPGETGQVFQINAIAYHVAVTLVDEDGFMKFSLNTASPSRPPSTGKLGKFCIRVLV